MEIEIAEQCIRHLRGELTPPLHIEVGGVYMYVRGKNLEFFFLAREVVCSLADIDVITRIFKK